LGKNTALALGKAESNSQATDLLKSLLLLLLLLLLLFFFFFTDGLKLWLGIPVDKKLFLTA